MSTIGTETKVFVDVGGYEGDASYAALDPIYGFHKVLCFEPVKECAASIRARITDSRLEVLDAALADMEGTMLLHSPGSVAGSLFADHSHATRAEPVPCKVMKASSVIGPLLEQGARIHLKLNCEGGEIPIMEDLLQSGLLEKIDSILLDLDARKIPSLGDRMETLLRTLNSLHRRNWYEPEEVQYGWQCTFGGIRNWLRVSGAQLPGWRARLASLRYNVLLFLAGDFRGYYKFLIAKRLPPGVLRFYSQTIRGRIDNSQSTGGA